MDQKTIRGKTALITGAAKRIGRAMAIALADEGVNIVVHYRASENEAKQLLVELDRRGVKSWAMRADFGQRKDYETLIDRAARAAGSLDILVNNASVFAAEKLDELTLDTLTSNIKLNAWVPFVLSREFAKRIGRGKIINLLDTRIQDNDRYHVGYLLSKLMLAEFTRMTALAYAPDITVNGVAPGLILPPAGKDENYVDRLKKTVPLKRRGSPEDVAEALVFLVKSDFITGQVIFVDGGRHLTEYT